MVGEIYRIPNTAGQLSIKRYEDTITDIINHKSHDILIGSDQNFDYIEILRIFLICFYPTNLFLLLQNQQE